MTTLELEQTQTPMRHWSLDSDRTSVEFTVKTFWGLATVRGHFDRCHGSYESGLDGTKIELTLDANGIDTGNVRRDTHLRSADFFDVADHPQVRFKSTHVHDAGGGQLYGTGELEAGGASEPVAFAATVREIGDELEVEGTSTVDHRQLGMSSGLMRMIRPDATIHVTARLV